MSDPFVHLRVASGYSLQYGASHPSALVARAAEYDMDTLALTDRDGLYGAVRFAKACQQAGVAPVVGVDLAVRFPGRPRASAATRGTAAKGGQLRDPRLPRVVVTATSRRGWAQLCRLVTATHLAGTRGTPVADPEVIARYAAGGDLMVMLGSDSALGMAVGARRPDLAGEELARWRDRIAADQLVIGVTNQRTAGYATASAAQAGAMLRMADEAGLAGVLTNDVRMAERRQAATIDVLDAARRLVPLDARNIDRANAEGFLKSGKEMVEVAEQVALLAGRGRAGAERLFADTRTLGIRCRLDPRADIGLGEIHLPEFDVLGTTDDEAMGVLRARCEAGADSHYGGVTEAVARRLDDELAVIGELGFASYFLTVVDVVQLVRELGIRCAARGSGAGSLVNYLLGISGVDPLAYGLVMERFLSPLRKSLPDIDLDVESARRSEIYQKVLQVFGGERVACVAMVETYRVRHAVRDVGAALGLPPAEVDAIAKSFPHIRARDARAAIRDLPELRAAGLSDTRLGVLFDLVESLDGLPRHIALHPCGVLLSDTTLGDRTPLEASFGGFPMSQFDKDDIEDLGLLKLDVLGIRMQSAMAHALDEAERTQGHRPDIDGLAPFDDPLVYDMIGRAQTLGCFQIESPGQRELVGKFGPRDFNDIIIDISLFRPGPVKSNMVIPFLNARQGWTGPEFLHPDLVGALAETEGVVVFHEQIIRIVAIMTGCSYAQADEVRRALGEEVGKLNVRDWFFPATRARGYDQRVIDQVWFVLESFASFGFCKAHAAAFALPTYQSAWLKRYHPAAFLSGVLTHDPGMYPRRLILEEARRMNIEILGVDVNRSTGEYRAVVLGAGPPAGPPVLPSGLPDATGWGIRLSLADIKGISDAEVLRIVAGQPYGSLHDFWVRARVAAPVVERLILAGGFDSIHHIGDYSPVQRRGTLTRRDLLLAMADLVRTDRGDTRTASRGRGLRRIVPPAAVGQDPRDLAQRQVVGQVVPARTRQEFAGVQLALPLAGEDQLVPSGLPEMDARERLEAELEILGMDASSHIMDGYQDFVTALGITRSAELMGQRNHAELLVAGVKVATQTPPVRSGRRVIFLTLDDGTGPADATFFEDVQGPYAATVFNSWLLVVRGKLRRTGPHGVSLLATGAWELPTLHKVWQQAIEEGQGPDAALAAVRAVIDEVPGGVGFVGEVQDGQGVRRVLVHPSGYIQSPYADVQPAGVPASQPPRKLWHSSPGSSGR